MLQRLEDDDATALADHEPVAALVERAGRALGVIVASRQGAHGGEPADHRLVDAGLGPSRDHHVRVAATDRLRGLADRVAAGGTRRHRREVRAGHAEVDRDLARAGVRDAHRDEERADAVGAAQHVRRDAVHQCADATKAGPEDHAGPLGEVAFEASRQPGLVQRLARRHQPEGDVAVGAALILAIEDTARVEVVHLAGDLRRDPRRIEGLDPADAGAAGDEVRPARGDVVAERREESHARDDDPPAVRVVHRTSFPVRTVAAR